MLGHAQVVLTLFPRHAFRYFFEQESYIVRTYILNFKVNKLKPNITYIQKFKNLAFKHQYVVQHMTKILRSHTKAKKMTIKLEMKTIKNINIIYFRYENA